MLVDNEESRLVVKAVENEKQFSCYFDYCVNIVTLFI